MLEPGVDLDDLLLQAERLMAETGAGEFLAHAIGLRVDARTQDRPWWREEQRAASSAEDPFRLSVGAPPTLDREADRDVDGDNLGIRNEIDHDLRLSKEVPLRLARAVSQHDRDPSALAGVDPDDRHAAPSRSVSSTEHAAQRSA